MITTILFYITIVGLLGYAQYLRNTLKKKKHDHTHTIRRVGTVQSRWSHPHDHVERQRLPNYAVRSNLIW